MAKRKAGVDEEEAEKEIQAAIKASQQASPDEQIAGLLSPSSAALYLQIRPEQVPPPQYKRLSADEHPIILTYFAIKGLGEVPRLILAEAGVSYDTAAVFGGSDQSVSMEWRARSPTGLLPMLSGCGIPRSTPISQSGSIICFLSKKFGLEGTNEMESVMSDVLYETAKDMGQHKDLICAKDPEKDMAKAKLPFAMALRVERILEDMPDPGDDSAALNYGQIQLLYLLMNCEARRSGCVRENLSTKLDDFRIKMESRKRIASYMKSSGCFPYTKGEIGLEGGYEYVSGPIQRGEIR